MYCPIILKALNTFIWHSNSFVNKADELQAFADANNIDVVFVAEAFLKPNIHMGEGWLSSGSESSKAPHLLFN